ncbi:hypothetical protein EDB84DRAFT_1442651 [Lactarius hengduanensis]|nr:hypothetical protein EDB84DRAFT_1442651 [Lactarius hengduanensis]
MARTKQSTRRPLSERIVKIRNEIRSRMCYMSTGALSTGAHLTGAHLKKPQKKKAPAGSGRSGTSTSLKKFATLSVRLRFLLLQRRQSLPLVRRMAKLCMGRRNATNPKGAPRCCVLVNGGRSLRQQKSAIAGWWSGLGARKSENNGQGAGHARLNKVEVEEIKEGAMRCVTISSDTSQLAACAELSFCTRHTVRRRVRVGLKAERIPWGVPSEAVRQVSNEVGDLISRRPVGTTAGRSEVER